MHVVKDAPEQLRAALAQRVKHVVDVPRGDTVLPHYEQRQIRQLRDSLRIGEHPHRGRVDDDEVGLAAQVLEKRPHPVAAEQLRCALARLRREDRAQALLLRLLRRAGLLSPQYLHQLALRLRPQQLILRGLVQIRVDQHDALALLRERNSEVRRHGGLALVLGGARDHEHLAPVVHRRVADLGGELADLLGEVEPRDRHRDEQALVIAPQPGAQRLVLRLMVDRREQARVDAPVHALRRLDGVGQHARGQQPQHHRERADQKRLLRRRAQAQRVRRRGRYHGAVQLAQDHVLKHMIRQHIVILHQKPQRPERVRRVIRRHGELQQVRLRDDRGRKRPRQLRAELAARQLAERLALEQLRERLRDLGGRAEIGVNRRVARVFQVDGHGGARRVRRVIRCL